MTFDSLTSHKTSLLCILIVVLTSLAYLPTVWAGFQLKALELTSDPAVGTAYKGKRIYDPKNVTLTNPNTNQTINTHRIMSQEWEPEKVPPLITYTLDCYAKGPGTLTFYLKTSAESLTVGNWKPGAPLSDGEGTYYFYVREKNEDNYDFEANFDKPFEDECIPYLYKGYLAEVVESTNSTLSIDGGRATFNGIDTHVGGANTSQKTLQASAGWNTLGVSGGYSQSATQNWIYRPSATSLQIPEISLSLTGTYSVDIDDKQGSGSQNPPPPEDCVPCPNCGEYVHNADDHEIGTCKIDVKHRGCGAKRYSCDTDVQKEWHKERTCNNCILLSGFCGETFRHCANRVCDYRWISDRGHSDNTVSKPPPGVPNKYPESHFNEVPPDDNTTVTTPPDNTPNCASCTNGCSACPTTGACGHTYTSSETNNHKWIYGSCSAGHAFYACQSYSHRSESWACGHTIYVCSPGVHVEERCSGINSNGQRCTYTFWRCQHPNVPSYGPSHVHAY